AIETLAVEKEARLRAETKEEDERRERISTTAQTAAVQQQHSKEMEAERVARVKLETESEIRAQASMADKAALREELVVAEERQLELEAEVRGLKAAVVDAQTNAEQLEEMSRALPSARRLRWRSWRPRSWRGSYRGGRCTTSSRNSEETFAFSRECGRSCPQMASGRKRCRPSWARATGLAACCPRGLSGTTARSFRRRRSLSRSTSASRP
ncbi:unnamed protein product, partial [Ectocarpus sp. 8 AP-2014]